MVKLTGPLYSLGAHGWLGWYTYRRRGLVRLPYPVALFPRCLMHSIYYSAKGWCYQLRRTWHGIVWSAIRPPISAQPKTGDQIWWEKVFADAVAGWQGLTGLEKGIWNSYSYPKHPSGYNRYIRDYLKKRYPTPNMNPGSVVFIGADGRLAEDNVNFKWDNTLKKIITEIIGPEAIKSGAVWGASSKKLLNYVPFVSIYPAFLRKHFSDSSDFVATIATLPGGVVLTYNDPTSGDEKCIMPFSSANLGKVVLHNTTRGDSALINYAVIDTNTIGLTAAVPGTWQVGDTITTRSQTNLDTYGPAYYFDVDLSGTIGAAVAALVLTSFFTDTGGVDTYQFRVHPYETYASYKVQITTSMVANIMSIRTIIMPMISQRLTVLWRASGAGAADPRLTFTGYFEEAAT